MLTAVVPHEATESSVAVWIGISDVDVPPAGLTLAVEKRPSVPLDDTKWRLVTAGGALSPAESRTFVQTVTIDGLAPDTAVRLSLLDARADCTTLPAALPVPGGKPFTVLLSSCFAATSPHPRVLEAIDMIAADAPIHAKFLCGDQVYLDFPGFLIGGSFGAHPEARFLARYVNTFMVDPGYRRLLSLGASWFTADDHEFWNNYPNFQLHLPPTFTEGGRKSLGDMEASLFGDFQCADPARAGRNRSFRVGQLSFMIVDTRVHRTPGDDAFVAPADLDEILVWLRNLPGPGVIVIGQPLFADPANALAKRVGDRTLPNYHQYEPLAAAVAAAPHSVLILTGDVHFGRVASAAMAGLPATEVTEVIASPLALISGRHSTTGAPPAFFPAKGTGGRRGPTSTLSRADAAGDNLCTLQFADVSGRVQVAIKHWFLTSAGVHAEPAIVRMLD